MDLVLENGPDLIKFLQYLGEDGFFPGLMSPFAF